MEYLVLVFVHLASVIFWGGGVILAGFFLVPAIVEAGPAGGAVMGGIVKRKFPTAMTVVGLLAALSGLRLYMMRLTAGGGAWLATPNGIALTLGAVLGLGALVIGLAVQRPTAMRIGALGEAIRAAGGPPTPEQAGEMKALTGRLARAAKIAGWHVVAALLLMTSSRLVSAL